MKYEYKCECGKVKEELREVEKRHDPVICECGKLMKLIISKSTVKFKEGFLKW